MMNRALMITDFLSRHRWDSAELIPLPADFSPRRYARLTKTDGITAILMDADADQNTVEFVALAKLLRTLDVRAPKIYADHAAQGLVLMEDLGGPTLGALMDAGTAPANPYQLGMDILGTLHRNFKPAMVAPPFPALPLFDAARFTDQVCLFLDEYVPSVRDTEITADERALFRAAWMQVLRMVETTPQSLLLRDFMPDNIIIGAKGAVGVLDFELSGLGPIAYDIVSFCEELRRDGGLQAMPLMIDYYYATYKPACSKEELVRACTILAAQRTMRFLGNAMRQVKKGRTEKRAWLPRVERKMNYLLKDPTLAPVKVWMEASGITLAAA